MPHDVLISYSASDKVKADAICHGLEAEGIRCWIAPRDVPPGSEWAGSIVQAIESAKAMVLVYSKNADESDQVKREVERAISEKTPLIPVRIEDAAMSPAFEYYMGSIHWLDAIAPPIEDHIDKLVVTLRSLIDQAAGEVADGNGGHAQLEENDTTDQELDDAVVEPPVPTPAPDPTPTPTPKPDARPTPTPDPVPVWKRPATLGMGGIVVVAGLLWAFWPEPATVTTTTVPRVVGIPEAEAESQLQQRGLSVTVELALGDLEPGHALRTEPRAGEEVDTGSDITLFVDGDVAVPDLRGSTEDAARLAVSGLRAGTHGFPEDRLVTVVRSGGVEGQVLGTEPAAGEALVIGDTLRLIVAGPQMAVPDVVGEERGAAVAALRGSDLEPQVVMVWEPEHDEAQRANAIVVGMEPGAGGEVDRGSTVTIQVAGKGGWAYLATRDYEIGQELDMPRTLTVRREAFTGAANLGAISMGTPIRVLDRPTGDGWVKIVETGGG